MPERTLASFLEAEIRDAFAAVEHPGDWCLVNSREGVEPERLAEEFKGKTDWRSLDAAFLDQAPDGFGTALSFFSDEAFRFYLPAYLIADLHGRLLQADPVFILTHGLESGSRGQKINPRRYGERTWHDYARHRFAVFDARQSAAIAAYLEHRKSGTSTDFERTHIVQALETYWTARAQSNVPPPRGVRQALEGDCAVLVRLFRQLGYETTEKALCATLERCASSLDRAFVAEADARVLGVVVVNVLQPLHAPAPWGRISALVVDEAARSKGVGSVLVERAVEYCRALGASRVELTSAAHRPDAHGFYLQKGFEEKPKRFVKIL